MNPIFMYAVWSTIAIAAMLCSLFLLRLILGLGPLIVRLDAIAQWLEDGRPRYTRILDDLGAQMQELRGISESAHHMASTADEFTDGLRSAAQPLVDDVRALSQATKHARAAFMAVRAGLDVLMHHRRDAECEPGISDRTEQES